MAARNEYVNEYAHMTPKTETTHIRAALLDWYDAHRRDLAWRAGPGKRPDPYAVWLSEIMLQQTTVATVGPYFGNFMARWPDVKALAAADLDEVLVAWQGLGYYARARNLHKCARVVVDEHDGVFPESLDGLQALPGIGAYTAAAIAAIAFDIAAMPVDGNIERVTARLFEIATPLPVGKAEITAAAEAFTDAHRPGDFAQAMMDLGATVCTPKSPKCLVCPLREFCRAHTSGDPSRLPARAPKAKRPERCCVMFWLQNPAGEVLLRKRAERGLLGGMTELPSTLWRDGDWPDAGEIEMHQPLGVKWVAVDGEAIHVFTHFRLTIRVLRGTCKKGANADGLWVLPADFAKHALPTVIKKAVKLVRYGDD